MGAATLELPANIDQMAGKAKEYYTAALRAEQAGKIPEALRLYKAAAREDMNFRQAFVNLGAIYSRARRPDLALGFFRRALELGEDAAVYFNLGSECYKLGRLPECEQYLKSALRTDKRLLKAHILLAYVYDKQKRYDKAAIYFTNALKIDAGSRPAALGLAVSLSDQERFEEALKVIESYQARAQKGGDAFLENLRAGLLLKLDRYEDSLNEYRKLTQSSEKYVSFTQHLEAARAERESEYAEMFEGIDNKIRERTTRLRKKIEQRKARLAQGKAAAGEDAGDLQNDLKDMVDLSFLHLFNGDTDKALRFLMQARKMKKGSEKN